MKIILVGPGLMDIPPTGWGAIEIVIWEIKESLEKLGHQVFITNTTNMQEILQKINEINPDFVEVHYDPYASIINFIKCPSAIVSHFGGIHEKNKGSYFYSLMSLFKKIKPNIFCLSKEMKYIFSTWAELDDNKLFIVPNGTNSSLIKVSNTPSLSNKTIYIGTIDKRKRQSNFQSIDSIDFVGPYKDIEFKKTDNYLGEWTKEDLYLKLTEYGNLALLSTSEAHPLVCIEALSAGLGLVVSENASANLDYTLPFINIIPENKINNLEYVENILIKNREYSVLHRKDILEYAKYFDWSNIINNFHIPAIEEVIKLYGSKDYD